MTSSTTKTHLAGTEALIADRRTGYALQFLGSLLILSLPIPSGLKLLAFALWWLVTFRRLSRKEWIIFGVCNAVFTLMDMGATRHGAFRFQHPDFLGLPLYEFFMWGFLILHAMRMLQGPRPQPSPRFLTPLLMALFAAPFVITAQADLLLCSTLAILILALVCFHEPMDFAYVGYLVLIGALWEYAGVWTNEWAYPDKVPGGVPLWFVTMWGGIGLFVRRAFYPLVCAGGAARPRDRVD